MRALRRRGKPAETVENSIPPIFSGVVVKVDCPPDKSSTKNVLLNKLEEGGAQCTQRLRKDVTHVVFVRQGEGEDDVKRIEKIREFERKNVKRSGFIIVVSPLWVDECMKKGARLDEGDFRPLESISGGSNKRGREFLKPPALSLGNMAGCKQKNKKSKTPRGGIVPKSLDHFEIDHSKLDSARKLEQCQDFEEEATQTGEATQDAAMILAKGLCDALEIPETGLADDDLDTPLGRRCSQRMSVNKIQEQSKESGAQVDSKDMKKTKKSTEPSQRFSLRRLFVYPERQVLLDKNLPQNPVEVKPVLKKTIGQGVPIPEIERVPSPWGTPRETGRIDGIDFSTASKASKSRGTPLTKRRIPSPWSTLRPWDISMKRKSLLSQNSSQPSPLCQIQEVATHDATSGEFIQIDSGLHILEEARNKNNLAESPGAIESKTKSPSVPLSQEILTIPSASQIISQEVDANLREVSGIVAVTSVTSSVLALCKTAVEKLSGLKLWENNSRKNRKITHLIIGDSRRTFKTMLAILHGAYLLRPEYVTASLDAGYWLPEEFFLANVIFQEGSARARQAKSCPTTVPEGNPSFLLQGKKVSIYSQGKRARDESYQVVRKICQELGATLFHLSEADICIVMDEDFASRPPGIPQHAKAVTKEWLFQSVCSFQLVDTTDFSVPRE